jgi:hypothetical protein
LVGIFGVGQFIVGALITAASFGIAGGLGTTMMIEGAKDCFKAIFNPEEIISLR